MRNFRHDFVHVKIHRNAVGDRLGVPVFLDEILVEKRKGLLVWCRRQTDDIGIPIIQHLPPQPVNGTVAFVHDNEVKKFRREVGIINHGERFPRKRRYQLARRFLVLLVVHCRFAFEDGIKPLDGGDTHVCDGIKAVGFEVLDVVEFRKLAPVVRRDVLLKFSQSLPPQIAPVHEEQNALRLGVTD